MLDRQLIIEKLKYLKPILKRQYGLSEIALFGSYARDTQTPESDIDLMVSYDDANYKNFLHTIDALEATFPGIPVQAIIRGAIKPHYFDSIKGDLIYA